MPQFEYNIHLYLLALLLVMLLVFLYARNQQKKAAKKLGDPAMVKLLLSRHKSFMPPIKFMFLFLAMALLIVTFANLRVPAGMQKVERKGIDVMIALDVSKSMLAKDIQPNRLEKSKQFLNHLIDKLKEDRVGIVVFAGKAYLQMPLTGDHAAAKMYLSAANPESIPTQGTVISDALKMSYAAFNSKEKKYKAVILISDGEDHEEGAEDVAKQMAEQGVSIFTIGLGSTEGAPLYDADNDALKKDAAGNTVISKLNEAGLKAIAEMGNGAYHHFVSTEAAVDFTEGLISSMDQRTTRDESLMNFKSLAPYLLGLALFFLLLELFLDENRKLRTMKLKPFVGIFIFLLASTPVFAQSEKKLIQDGNNAYQKEDYGLAASLYQKALATNPENATAKYNLGNALYKLGRKDSAMLMYDAAEKNLVNPEEKGKSLYNKGVVLQLENQLDSSIATYKQALRLNQNDEDARHNLQIALKKKQDEQKKKDEEDKKNQNQDKKPQPQKSKLTKKEAEEKLKALMQQEKRLQDKLHKSPTQSPVQPDKDW